MKTNFKKIGLIALATLVFSSCTNNDSSTPTPATAAAFKGIKENGLKKNTQNFTATAGAGVITLTSTKGVVITLNGNALTKNGSPVTGAIDITFVELFDKGNMLISNKPTMGVMVDGKKSLLKSGGEFFIKASQGGVDLVTTSSIQLKVPASLTGGVDPLMTLWTGAIDANDNLAWNEVAATAGGKGGVTPQGGIYFVTFGSFGWTNVDRFYSDPRPKTTILVGPPAGYNITNCAIFISYDGEGSAMANLDTYTAAGLFSEHYGQIPIGLACHIIFVSEDNGQWKYAIKAATITAGAVYNFTLAETTTGTEAQVIAAINAL